MEKYLFGALRDTDDPRDFIKEYGATAIPNVEDHPVVDLSEYVDHVYDQGELRSCTANALCSAYGLNLTKQSKTDSRYKYFDPSRLFVYYNARAYTGRQAENVGLTGRDAIKAIHEKGVCKESTWPYVASQIAVKPTAAAVEDAHGNTISKYERLHQDLDQFRACLKSGHPFILGFEVYKSFYETDKKGKMPIPSPAETAEDSRGGHCVLIVGYNEKEKSLKALNSWGETFADKGFFYLPYAYAMTSHCFSFWKITYASESGVNP